MQDDCLDVSNQPFYKRWKKLIPLSRGASFRTSKITLMLMHGSLINIGSYNPCLPDSEEQLLVRLVYSKQLFLTAPRLMQQVPVFMGWLSRDNTVEYIFFLRG